jgi:uncharacterized membrane protein YwaF
LIQTPLPLSQLILAVVLALMLFVSDSRLFLTILILVDITSLLGILIEELVDLESLSSLLI